MKYHMRRTEREMTDPGQLRGVLQGCKYVSLALCRENEPYIVTMNYGYDEAENALYLHCAQEGLKLEFIAQNPAVCGTAIEDRGYLHGECAHAFRSVVFWGELHAVEELEEKKHAMQVMLDHLENDPDRVREEQLKTDKAYERVVILRLDMHEITGKEGR
jgi:nitroimidazol reductase NimA-like FMN-containing flavoprotein (pyridoxamine 5'-phosphate oxidase superfamily)